MKVSEISQNNAFLPELNIEASQENALESAFFKTGKWPSLKWWEVFQSEPLNSLIEESLVTNPDISAARQSILMAQEAAKKSRSSLFPSIFFGGDESWGKISKNGVSHLLNPSLGRVRNEILLNFGFEYEFDFWGKYRNLFKSSKSLYAAEIAQLKQAELIVSTSVAQAFYALQSTLQLKKIYSELFDVQTQILELVSLLESHAIATAIDTASAKQNVDDTSKILNVIGSDIALGMHLVNILRAQSPDAALQVPSCLEAVPTSLTIPDHLSSDLLIRRPDLVAAILQVESYAYQVNAAVADFFPRIDLKGHLGVDSLGYKHLMNWQSGIIGLLPSIHIPIFKAGALKANLKIKKAEFEKAIDQYNQLLLKSLQEVSDSLYLTETWYQQKEIQKDIVCQAELKVDLIDLKANSGMSSRLELYYEQEKLLLREIQETEITLNQYISIINLIRSLGGGFSNEEIKDFS